MEITTQELRWLNFYRASELEGGLVLGQLARRVRDPELMLRLIRHSAEEVLHAQLWAETIFELGGAPSPTSDTYQRRYSRVLGAPQSTMQVLALTQIFERRVHRHFLAHSRRPGTHASVRDRLLRMIEEERDHLSWVKGWLDAAAEKRPEVVRRLMTRYAHADELIYGQITEEYGFRSAA